MTRLLSIFLSVLMLASLGAPARADDAADRTAAAKELLSATHAVANMEKMIPIMMTQFLKAMPQPSSAKESQMLSAFQSRFESKFKAALPVMADELASVYTKRFTAQELRQIADFWKSPVGQKVASEQVAIATESSQIGMGYGQRLAKEAIEEAQKESAK